MTETPAPTPPPTATKPVRPAPCPVCGRAHFGQCHRCPHTREIERGDFAERDFATVPCFSCRLSTETSNHGQSFTSLDLPAKGGRNDRIMLEALAQSNSGPDGDAEPTIHHVREMLAGVLRAWLSLSPVQRDVVAWRLVNPHASLDSFRPGHAKQAVLQALQRAVARVPGLVALLGDRLRASHEADQPHGKN